MDKETVNFSLPRSTREFVNAQIESGRHGNLSEYMRELTRRDQDRSIQERLDGLLLASLQAIQIGQGIKVTPEFWQKRREELLARHETRLKARENGLRE